MAFRKINLAVTTSEVVDFTDSLMVLGKGNTSPTDIGFLGKTGPNTYTGLIRDSDEQKFYLIDSVTLTSATPNDVNPLQIQKADLTVNRLEATEFVGDITGNVTGNVAGDLDGYIRDTNGNVLLNNDHGNAGFGGNIFSSGASSFSGSVNFTGATISGFSGDTAGTHTGNVVGNVTGNVVGNIEGNILNSQGQAVIDNSGALYPTIFRLPKGIASERPSPASEGMMFFNTTTKMFEGYNGTDWVQLVPSTYNETT